LRYSPSARRLALAIRVALIAAVAVTVFAAPVRAATSASAAESLIVGWINADRLKAGLAPLRTDSDLPPIAGVRASRMAAANSMSHSVGGNIASQLKAYGAAWYRYGEAIGWSTSAWSTEAARSLYRGWMNSSSHRALLMSKQFNYIGVGLAYRSSNHKTFGSVMLTESPDHTGSIGRVTSVSRSGDDVRWTWSGHDPNLQTHTAGLRFYDVQYRIGSGSWVLIRNDTTGTSLSAVNRVGGRTYSIRVRATDRRGNVGAWSSESRIWVP
jgi:uncharacterized protein YkwD